MHNLYFVAYEEKIYVYEPGFPNQELAPEPALILDAQPSRQGLTGYINRSKPHAINNLVVQFLGHEEILAVVRDDGDVDAFLTRHIYNAIERRSYADNNLGVDAADVKPFFQRNVERSAWGLAVHTKARMIAVSSNNLEITVFTFALTPGTNGPLDLDEALTTSEERIYRSGSDQAPCPDRESNDTRIIQNGNANIPSIAFCNTGHDPTGRWLISTDISGVVRSWDVHTLSPGGAVVATLHPILFYGENGDRFNSGHFDRFNSGWAIMFLDPRSFRNTKTIAEALGVSIGIQSVDQEQSVWDISDSLEEVHGKACDYFDPSRQAVEVMDGNYLDPLSSMRQIASPQDRAAYLSPSPLSVADADNDPLLMNRFERDPTAGDGEALAVRLGVEGEQVNINSERDNVDHGYSTQPMRAPADEAYDSLEEDAEDGNESDNSGLYLNRQQQQQHRRRPPRLPTQPQVFFQKDSALCGDLPCPILHGAIRTMYLFQPSCHNSAYEHRPLVTLSEPFAQSYCVDSEHLQELDRCNMHAQIPALGMVVVGTQAGRVAVLSLTQCKTEAPDQRSASGMTLKTVYGYRVDYILPLRTQEAAGHRPNEVLHGIAVGPVQGTEHLAVDSRRWRLMLMYQDHSVLSYEIGRAKSETIDIIGSEVIL